MRLSALFVQSLALAASLVSTVVGQATQFSFTMSVDPPPMAGQDFTITWVPGTYQGKVLILINSYTLDGSVQIPTTSATLASVANTGTYIWSVPKDTCGVGSFSIATQVQRPVTFSKIFTITGGACEQTTQSVYQTTVACTTFSSSAPQPTGSNRFINKNAWIYPVVGKSVTIQWNPSSDPATVSLQLTFHGYVPNDSNSIWITKSAPNTGSFTWEVPASLTTGEYLISLAHSGVLFDDTQSVVVGTVVPSLCGGGVPQTTPSASILKTTPPASSSSTSTTTPSRTSASSTNSRQQLFPTLLRTISLVSALATANFTSILQISNCPISVTPSYTTYINATSSSNIPTTTYYAMVGCSAPVTTATVSNSLNSADPRTCHQGDVTFSVSGSSKVCCPSHWKTTRMDDLWCYTTIEAAGGSSVQKRSSVPDLWPRASTSGATAVAAVVTDAVFIRAANVSSSGVAVVAVRRESSIALCVWAAVLGLLVQF